jgi:hypothetical protein
MTFDDRNSADKLVLVAPTQRQELWDLTESDERFAVEALRQRSSCLSQPRINALIDEGIAAH